ncbi:hypothetical protein [Kitasatospora sp. NPDC057500]|uniref:hypothetical protein n=1 Tax=Kitasatospora sp. NPDC057500 TaxID=3346151 RepID=UPI00369F3229
MTSVNTVAANIRTGRRAAVPGTSAESASRGTAAVVEVIPLWAAPSAPVLPVTRRR